jgi:hypothetical protein
MEKKYTVPLTAAQLKFAVVGAVFQDHGVKMRITRIGTSYTDWTGKPAFDSWAVPVEAKA